MFIDIYSSCDISCVTGLRMNTIDPWYSPGIGIIPQYIIDVHWNVSGKVNEHIQTQRILQKTLIEIQSAFFTK